MNTALEFVNQDRQLDLFQFPKLARVFNLLIERAMVRKIFPGMRFPDINDEKFKILSAVFTRKFG